MSKRCRQCKKDKQPDDYSLGCATCKDCVDKHNSTASKPCKACGEELPPGAYHVGAATCKKCVYKQQRERYNERLKLGHTKQCKVCGLVDSIDKFPSSIPDICTKCYDLKRKEEREERAEAGETRECMGCKRTLPVTSFGGNRELCGSCMQKKHKNKEREMSAQGATRVCRLCNTEKPLASMLTCTSVCNSCKSARDREKLKVFLALHRKPCEECGCSDMRTIEFAHYDPAKKFRNSKNKPMCIAKITPTQANTELPLGRWLCANCHRKETWAKYQDPLEYVERGRNDNEKLLRVKVLLEKDRRGGCKDCGLKFCFNHRYVFDFDHLPGTIKLFSISTGVCKNVCIEALEAEMAKCELVCANCHRIRTFMRKEEAKAVSRKRKKPDSEREDINETQSDLSVCLDL